LSAAASRQAAALLAIGAVVTGIDIPHSAFGIPQSPAPEARR
jgi:hypothetical protein